ncbi:MAG: alkaline phosphatase family protein [Burkholderiales bacterium]|nr:alkaline phosphatase family protein [Burkholderiales bacterium]
MKTASLLRAALAIVLGLALASCAALAPAPRPKLVVLIVIDGLPQRQVVAYRDQLAPDGFARFLDRGASFEQAYYGHAFTVTGAGHATVLTGAYPHRTGIIGNEWIDRASGRATYCTADPQAQYIGHATHAMDGTSPRNLKVETLGDVLRRLQPRSKVIAVSGKDRGAILTAGHAGTAYMYLGDSGRFASTTYYLREHPAWVEAFNGARPADRFFHAEWKPLLPEAAYGRSLPDDQPWYGPRGGRLPMTMGAPDAAKPDAAFYAALLPSPFADALTLDFARAAIAGEHLGADDAPDLLAISLSGHDYVNHRWSAESRLSQDHFLQIDRMLQSFFEDLDRRVGRDEWLAVLTADHGFMPAPEWRLAHGLQSGRIDGGRLLAAVNADLAQRFQAPRLVSGLSASALVLDGREIAARGLDFDAVAAAARDALLAQPGLAAAYTRQELLTGSRAGAPFFEAMRNTWHPDVSGDVQYVTRPYWMFGKAVATHGSPYDYDTHVPLLLWGPRWVRPGAYAQRVEAADIAPTLAQILRVPAPAACEGRPLPLAMP